MAALAALALALAAPVPALAAARQQDAPPAAAEEPRDPAAGTPAQERPGVLREPVLERAIPAGGAAAAAPAVRRPAAVAIAVTDRSGGVPRDLTAADLQVFEGGEPRPVLGVALPSPAGEPPVPWRLTVWLDLSLAADGSIGRAARVLEEQAAALAALGWVEVVAAGESPRLLLPASRDPEQIAAAFGRAFLLERGDDRLVEERRAALAAIAEQPAGEARRRAVATAAAEEAERVRRRQDLLLGWLAERPAAGREPRALLLVSDGWDLDPAAFYRQAAADLAERSGDAQEPGGDGVSAGDPAAAGAQGAAAVAPVDPAQPGELPAEATGVATGGETGDTGAEREPAAEPAAGGLLAAPTRELGRALAAYGWVVLPAAPRLAGERADPRVRPVEEIDPMTGERQVLGSVRLPGTGGRRAAGAAPAPAPPPVPAGAAAALGLLAGATGGELVTDPAALPGALAALGRRVRVELTSVQPPGAEPQPLAIRTGRRGWTVRAPEWIGGGTPRAVAALRARSLLAGDEAPGGLSVRAVVELPPAGAGAAAGPARLEARVGLEATGLEGDSGEDEGVSAASAPAVPRVTVAALDAAGRTTVEHPAATVRRDGSDLVVSLPLPVTADVDRVAVVVEDLATGRWGGALAGLVAGRAAGETGEEGTRFDAALGLLPAPKPVNLLRPEGRVLRGDVTFEAVISDPAVARIEFRVDGRRVADSTSRPHAAEIDLGRLPLMRRIEAVAYDAAGAELGRDALVVNQGGRDFSIEIVSPTDRPLAGAVDLAAEVAAPDGRRIQRVELYRNGDRLATLFEPPWRHRLLVPEGPRRGFLRAVAYLDDGSQAEDVFFLDEPGGGERLDVNLVELFVVVSDRSGRPVRGLDRELFRVREDGAEQPLAGFSAAGDLPVTVGLAIDSSASMFVKLPAVQEAATAFLGSLEEGRDRAFLVGFADRPALAAEPTLDLDRVNAAVGRLRPGGRTSLWESIVYSLVQLQGQAGRKALIVYSDGADQDEEFSYRTCLSFARKLGIPIYVIVSNNEALRTEGLSLRTFGDRLDRLTGAVGGRTFLVRTGEDLTAIYAQIERELSSQYLLTYYSDGPPRRGAWREVEVDVDRRGLTARTVTGYQM